MATKQSPVLAVRHGSEMTVRQEQATTARNESVMTVRQGSAMTARKMVQVEERMLEVRRQKRSHPKGLDGALVEE